MNAASWQAIRRTYRVDEAEAVWQSLADVGIDLDDVADQLEREGVASFQKSFLGLIDALDAKVAEIRAQP